MRVESIEKPDNVTDSDSLVSYTMSSNVFGFCVGDKIICRTNFDESEIRPNTLVVGETEHGRQVIMAGLVNEVLAVVVAYRREVGR